MQATSAKGRIAAIRLMGLARAHPEFTARLVDVKLAWRPAGAGTPAPTASRAREGGR